MDDRSDDASLAAYLGHLHEAGHAPATAGDGGRRRQARLP